MILVSLDQNSSLLKIITESGRFGVNVLASGQASLATTFARKGDDKFDGVAWYMDHDAPRLAGKGQWLVCRVDQQITAGDHVIIIGLVVHVLGALIHILLVIAIIAFIIGFLTRDR